MGDNVISINLYLFDYGQIRSYYQMEKFIAIYSNPLSLLVWTKFMTNDAIARMVLVESFLFTHPE